jgi:hypothetical protein
MYWGIPGPTLMRQEANAVAISGGTATLTSVTASTARAASLIVAPAAATSPRAQLALYAGSDVSDISPSPTLVTSIALDVDITNRGFTAKPDWGLIQVYDTNFLGVYDFDTGSSSTNARFIIFSKDGTDLDHGDRRYHFILGKYT